jgi:hypothetical protein
VTDPLNPDTDGDGLTDIIEITTYHTDPTLNDTDNGGVNDYIEVLILGTNPNDPSDDGSQKPIHETKVIIYSAPNNVSKGAELFTVKGNLTAIDNSSVWPAIVMVKIYLTSNITSGNFELAGSAFVKDPNGEFIIDCIIPNNISYGKNRILAHAASAITTTKQYNESWSYNNPEQRDENSTIEIFSKTKLQFINPRDAINKDAVLEGRGRLTDISGLPIANARVLIFFDEDWKETNITDGSGLLIYSFIANVPEEEIGDHEIMLLFEGNYYLEESRGNYTITVRSDNTEINITLEPVTVMVNGYIWLNGSITGLDNEPITSKLTATFEFRMDNNKIEKFFNSENGSFKVQIYLSPAEFRAGFYNVYVKFEGSKVYSDDTSNVLELFVLGQAKFEYPEAFIIYRDAVEVFIPVKLVDNTGVGLGGRYIDIFYELPSRTYSDTLVTSINGTISIPFIADYDAPLGSVDISLTYNTEPSSKLKGNSSVMKIFIKSSTIVEIEDFPLTMVRTEGYFIKGTVLDDQGQPAIYETVMVSLGSDDAVKSYFSTATDSNGRFELSILIPLSFPLGVNMVELGTGSSNKYEPYSYTYNVEIFSRPIININTNSTIKNGGKFLLTISLTEDNGKMPISKSVIIVYSDGIRDAHLITDKLGYAYYESTFPHKTDDLVILVDYNGSKNEYYTSSDAEITLVLEKDEEDQIDYIAQLNNYWLLILGCIIIIVILGVWLRWRRQHIPEIREALSDLMEKLETSDRTRRAIFDTYLKLLAILDKYGFIRKQSETAREFENAIQDALPQVSPKSLDSLTSLFEEARYSIHRMGKKDRVKAVKNLKVIQGNLTIQPT